MTDKFSLTRVSIIWVGKMNVVYIGLIDKRTLLKNILFQSFQ